MSIINSRWKRNSGILEPKGGENVNLTGTGQVASSGTILSGSDRIVDADTIYDYTNEAFKDVDAINISNVIFTLNNGTTLNESFGHMHIEYALVTNTVPLSGGTFTGALIGTDLTLSGDLTVAGEFTANGGIFKNVTTVNAATYDLLTTDYILHVTYTTTGAVTSLTLPTAQVKAGRIIIIKDAGGLAGTNNITIDTEGSALIDGAATAIINGNYNAINLYCDGIDWLIY